MRIHPQTCILALRAEPGAKEHDRTTAMPLKMPPTLSPASAANPNATPPNLPLPASTHRNAR